MADSVSVIVPAFNEEQSVYVVVNKISSVMVNAGIEHEILLIDDGSQDETAVRAESAGAKVIKHPENLGYGESLKTGIRNAAYDIIVITDADETYPVESIPSLLEAMGSNGMVVGARTGEHVSIPFVRKPFKWMLRRLAQFIVGRSIPDLNSGLRAFRKDLALKYFHILPSNFSFTTTITVASMCDGYRVEYLPIDYHRRAGRSKISPTHFFSFLLLVLRLSVLFKPLRVFLPVSIFCFGVGFAKLVFDIFMVIDLSEQMQVPFFQLPILSTTSVIFFVTGFQIALVGMVAEALARHNAIMTGGIRTGKD